MVVDQAGLHRDDGLAPEEEAVVGERVCDAPAPELPVGVLARALLAESSLGDVVGARRESDDLAGDVADREGADRDEDRLLVLADALELERTAVIVSDARDEAAGAGALGAGQLRERLAERLLRGVAVKGGGAARSSR